MHDQCTSRVFLPWRDIQEKFEDPGTNKSPALGVTAPAVSHRSDWKRRWAQGRPGLLLSESSIWPKLYEEHLVSAN
jgi:hypothetical protein